MSCLGLLLTGHMDGTLYAHCINTLTGEVKGSHPLHEEDDLMLVSCVGCLQIQQVYLCLLPPPVFPINPRFDLKECLAYWFAVSCHQLFG